MRTRLFSLLLLLLSGGPTMSAEPTRFDWSATESAPKHFPMRIVDGTFRYHGDPNGAGLYVPNNVLLYGGWGTPRSTHVTGDSLKTVPDKLDISFFSYLEDQFYRGQFDLPYDKLLKLFQDESRVKLKDKQGNDEPDAFYLMAGVAPGGTVAVWFRSGRGNKEVFFGQAQKVEMDFGKAFRKPVAHRAERTEYVNDTVKDVVPPDLLATLRQTGIPFKKWANYRTRYPWTPSFAAGHPPKDFGMSFFNGEGRNYNFPLEPDFTAGPQPVPEEIEFRYAINGVGKQWVYIIHFDETETLEAFARLAAKQLPLQLEFDPRYPKSQTQIRLHNGKEAIQLKKFTVEEW